MGPTLPFQRMQKYKMGLNFSNLPGAKNGSIKKKCAVIANFA
jgi:hypothetical protein